MSPEGRTTPRAHERTLIVLFLAGLAAPIVDMCLRPLESRTPRVEFREPADFPTLDPRMDSVFTLFTRAENWWDDFFGLRDQLIRLRNLTYWYGLHSPPTPEVVRGRNGWIFFDGNQNVACDRGASPLSEREVSAWVELFEARRAWLAARGIRQLYAFVPSKLLVYPEEAPQWAPIVGPSRLEQVLARFDSTWSDEVVYLKAGQLEEKLSDAPGDPAWYPFGTHFCDRGAYRAYAEIFAKLRVSFSALAPWPRSDFRTEPAPKQGDTWAGRFYLDRWMRHDTQVLLPNPPRRAQPMGGLPDDPRSDSDRLADARGDEPRLLVFHDSNGERLRPLVSEHFRESLWIWRYDFDIELIERWKPDVVLFLFGDRYFVLTSPTWDAGVQDVRAAFEASSEVLLTFDATQNQPPIRAQDDAIVESRAGVTWIWSPSAGDTVLLPPFEPREGSTTFLRLSIDSPWDTELDLMYQTRTEPRWARTRALKFDLEQGPNEVFLALVAPDFNGLLRLRPGRKGGRYRVSALEVRAGGG